MLLKKSLGLKSLTVHNCVQSDSLCFHFCLSTWISVAGDCEILIWSLLNFHMCNASGVIDQLLQLRPAICLAAWEDICCIFSHVSVGFELLVY